ncbi:MAG: hypothetical protein CMO01_13430 [Thalassobius sp.]|nr:hypothetical protein [Thalassovita sp.]
MEKKTTDLFRKANTRRSERHPLDNFKKDNNEEQEEQEEAVVNTPVRETPKMREPEPEVEDKPVRQSFLLDYEVMEKIKDIVYYERRNGNFEYSQKDAISDGIKALIDSKGDVPQRPEAERAKEKHRSDRIKKAKRKSRF